ncbi:MAG: ergothioneine biosynthesis protein EgtB [Saprospirales bacterium]|nr:ergothioneine biosynthesis protein EgtB [Saprospirales bacterium]
MILARELQERYIRVRSRTEAICRGLEVEDYVVQPVVDVSPPKWHIGHSTWFFETFLLEPFLPGYRPFHPDFGFLFNSYYETIGKRVLRAERGNMTRPTVKEVYRYRAAVDEAMGRLLETMELSSELIATLELGLQHEQQHQELLVTDIKYILGHNPLFPAVQIQREHDLAETAESGWLETAEGVYEIGHSGEGFCFDNELGRHKMYLASFRIGKALISNAEYLEFIRAGGYEHFAFWLAEGWDWVRSAQVKAPLYWHFIEGEWFNYTFEGLQVLDPNAPVCHISFFEADAFARWKGCRLPTEAEWEVAAPFLTWGHRWEWTNSAYLPYPGFQAAPGAVGEYNGKFMSNQMVLRGASETTPMGHSRITYRNFFQPEKRWQFTGLRLAQNAF